MSEGGASYTPPSRAPRLLRWIEVRPGEGAPLACSIGYFFCLLFAYYLLKPVRETFGIERGYDELPFLMTGTLLVMLVANPLFALLVSRVPRRRFLPLIYRFFVANLVVFFVLLRVFATGDEPVPRWLSYGFFAWLSVFNVLSVSVFWSFVTDAFTNAQAKRLFGLVSIGGTIGAISGGLATGALAEPLGAPGLMLLAAVALEGAARLALRTLRMADPSRAGAPVQVRASEPGRSALAGLRLVLSSRYLQFILLYVFIYGLLNTFLYMEQGRIVEANFADNTARTEAYAKLDVWQNAATLTIQLFLAGRLLRWIGLAPALMILPAVSLLGFAGLAGGLDHYAGGPFEALLGFLVLRRALHFGVDRPAREVLFTVVDADARYKSKNLIDTFAFRAGDTTGGWTVRWFALAGARLGMLAIPISAVGLVLGFVLGRMQARRVPSAERAAGPLGEGASA